MNSSRLYTHGYLCVDLSMHEFISIPSTWLGWMEEQEESSPAGV